MIMLGALIGLTDILPLDAVKKAVTSSVKAGTEDLNLRAVNAGVTYVEGMPAGA